MYQLSTSENAFISIKPPHDNPIRPNVRACTTDKSCDSGQRCAEGSCVGSRCNLQKGRKSGPGETTKNAAQLLCPESQMCWTVPVFLGGKTKTEENLTWRTDSDGMCAHRDMKCNKKEGGKYGPCATGWWCIPAPNGDGSPCGVGADPDCQGLCMFAP
jgi:hypothetical protein